MENVVSEAKETAGDDLKGVMIANFEDSEWETPYIREDAREEFPEEDMEKIFQDFGMESFASQNSYYSPMGELTQVVRIFEDGMILARFSQNRCVLLGLDRAADKLPALIEVTDGFFDE